MLIVGISPDRWDGQWMNRQHMMWALRNHAHVQYVQEPEPWGKSRRSRDEGLVLPAFERREPTLEVLRLPKLLCRRSRDGWWLRRAFELKSRIIRSHFPKSSAPFVLYLWHPALVPYVDVLKPDLVIYHLYDLLPKYFLPEHQGSEVQQQFRRLCENANIVLAGTPEQAAEMPRSDVALLPNAVPCEWYDATEPEPDDLARIPHPRVGYVGSINEKLELDWFERLADESAWQVVVTGPPGQMDAEFQARFARLCARSNVHFLGPKTAREVPRYMRGLDVGLMNYRRGRHCEFASPIKLYEYCAAGIPIVASPVHALTADPRGSDLVAFADSAQSAVAAVRKLLAEPESASRITSRRQFASENSWARRAEFVMQLIDRCRSDGTPGMSADRRRALRGSGTADPIAVSGRAEAS
jgi:glycosyltransferase involved in cell wall biosynthesis